MAEADSETAPAQRRIKSFVIRAGRMTAGQQRAFDDHWQDWGLAVSDGMIEPCSVFGRDATRVLEIGFGMGHSLAEMALQRPEVDFIGVEVHRPGIGGLMHIMAEQGIDNIRVYQEDAVEVAAAVFAPQSLSSIQIFFPDPWHKKRHHKRRLIQAPFIATLLPLLRPGGTIHLATDWENYAEQMLDVLEATPGLHNGSPTGGYVPRPKTRPLTKFERRGQRLGHGVWDLVFIRD